MASNPSSEPMESRLLSLILSSVTGEEDDGAAYEDGGGVMAPAGLLVSRVGENMSRTEDLRFALGVVVLSRLSTGVSSATPSVIFVAGFCTAAASSLLPINPDAKALSLRVNEFLFAAADGRLAAESTSVAAAAALSSPLAPPMVVVSAIDAREDRFVELGLFGSILARFSIRTLCASTSLMSAA